MTGSPKEEDWSTSQEHPESTPPVGPTSEDAKSDEWGDHASEDQKKGIIGHDPAFMGDKVFYRWVVFFLGSTIILGVGGSLLLAANNHAIPEGVTAVSSAALGALAGVLTGRATAR